MGGGDLSSAQCNANNKISAFVTILFLSKQT